MSDGSLSCPRRRTRTRLSAASLSFALSPSSHRMSATHVHEWNVGLVRRCRSLRPTQKPRMPSPSPVLIAEANHHLTALGQRIHARRKAMKISAQAIAQAANISRVTLLRIERGVPSVTMGAYMNALEALGFSIDLNTRALPPLPHLTRFRKGSRPMRSPTARGSRRQCAGPRQDALLSRSPSGRDASRGQPGRSWRSARARPPRPSAGCAPPARLPAPRPGRPCCGA